MMYGLNYVIKRICNSKLKINSNIYKLKLKEFDLVLI